MNLINLFNIINQLFNLEQEDLIELKEFLEEMIVGNKEQVRTEVDTDSIKNDQIVYNQFFINLHNYPNQSPMEGGDVKENKTEIDKGVPISQKIDLKNHNQKIKKGGDKMVDESGISKQEIEKIAKEGLLAQNNDCSNNNEIPIDDTVEFCCFIEVPANFDIVEINDGRNYEFAFNVEDKLTCCLEKDTVECTVKVNCKTITLGVDVFIVKIVGCIEYIISISDAVEGDKGGRIINPTVPAERQADEEVSICCTDTVCVNNIVGAVVRDDECNDDPCAGFNPLDVEGKIDVTETEVIEGPETECPNVKLIKIKGEFQLPTHQFNDVPPPPDRECECSLRGGGSGEVTNEDDLFFGGRAVPLLTPGVCPDCGVIEDSSLSYLVTRAGTRLRLETFPETFEIECPDPFRKKPKPHKPNEIVITGQGQATKSIPGEDDIVGEVEFRFEVIDGGEGPDADQFRMEITPKEGEPEELAHDSGLVDHDGNLIVGDC
ncbi:hypothetical protein MWH25_03130 [Natroniella acetigena]|uniref:hypothetical protein n=1 Tax=Natroniella acetigena TaxID=52004 RepID=UPI00200AAF97|nr:hypothetical protein [Natroniella acetigena]MCK8826737.1 hypothetical protein [Natroniella acetigena]